MITRVMIAGVIGLLSCAVYASDDVYDVTLTVDNDGLLMADNPRKDRRDDRQGDRDDNQDCRQEEGRVGDDKRECKQEERGEEDDEEKENEQESAAA